MRIRTPLASVWLDADDIVETFFEELAQGFKRYDPHPSNPQQEIIKARKTFQGKLGQYVAVKRVLASRPGGKDLLLVAVAREFPGRVGPVVGQ